MAFIKLSSENEHFSWILNKNPQTQKDNDFPFTKNNASYTNYLWFENDNEVSLYARNLHWKSTKSKYEHLDFTQYTSGEVYLQLIKSMLSTAINKHAEKDNVKASLEFTLYNRAQLDYSERMPDVVKSCMTDNMHSNIVIEAGSVKKALETCCVISLLSVFYDDTYYIDDKQYLKYLSFAVELTKEYSLLRQFVSFIKSDSLYKSALPLLDKTPFNINIARAFDARRNFYKTAMASKSKSKTLLDLGTGDGKYFKTHLKYYETVNAIEPDENEFYESTHALRKCRGEDVITLHQTDAMSYLNGLDTLENVDVLMTEVLEHIEYNESIKIIKKVLSLSPDKFLITLPNHDFNKHYGYKENEYRHDDHLWEPTIKEFDLFVDQLQVEIDGYSVVDCYIGDSEKTNFKNCATFAIVFEKL
jgi:hypothetical protein